MKRKAILIAGITFACLVAISITVFVILKQTEPVDKFKEYLQENKYSCSGDVCVKKAETVNGDITETATEEYRFKEHTFTTVLAHENSAAGTVWQREYIYNYADDTVTMNQYGTAEACTAKEPDTVYFLTKSGALECTKGDMLDVETQLRSDMLRIKEDLKKHLEESGAELKDIIL